ncbi:winged helix-turn-helix transcriptional regulator [Ralstonia pseudosolanacearum]|uniref:Transcriptional regulator n=2 Tax=Ralstonia solanacearum TaxID=305 RepID=A0AA92EHB6_RALSL|nr:helix-turn-helix domain-containing protein [Ralstonia pseudosolanacearum]QCX50995.1 transcriptional regulator [Ralstonia pseudosolanacearum]
MEATTTQAVELPLEPEHGTPPPEPCRLVLDILNRIGDKWTVMVIGTLSNGPMRFNAILRAISGISHRMLTLTLRGLEQDGLVKRTAYATIPPKVEYELTELGLSLIEPLRALGDWAVRNRPAIAAARAHFASLTAA